MSDTDQIELVQKSSNKSEPSSSENHLEEIIRTNSIDSTALPENKSWTLNEGKVSIADEFDIPSTSRKSFSFSIRLDESKDWLKESNDKNKENAESITDEILKIDDENLTIDALRSKSNICYALEGKGDVFNTTQELQNEESTASHQGDVFSLNKFKFSLLQPVVDVEKASAGILLLPTDNNDNHKDNNAMVQNNPLPLDDSNTSSNIASNSMICRICQNNTINEILISPCNCKGSLAYVHLTCLEKWLNQSSKSYCELCLYTYKSVQTKRYGLCQGIRIWLKHPRHRLLMQSDLVMSTLLTIITAGLISLSLFGMKYLTVEERKLGISGTWSKVAVFLFLLLVAVGYIVTLFLLIRDQVIPWYRWWKNTVNVRLVLSSSVMQGVPNKSYPPPAPTAISENKTSRR